VARVICFYFVCGISANKVEECKDTTRVGFEPRVWNLKKGIVVYDEMVAR
jgi:hypothetical protein